MSAENKINYGIKNVHYAVVTEALGKITYGSPIRVPGAVELSLDPRGDMTEFYADDMLYFSEQNSQGYEGSLTVANLPEQFLIDCLGEEKDTEDGVISEKTTAKGKKFALMFEFDGDVKATRHVLFYCSANRPTLSGQTKEESAEPQPNELTFNASARPGDYKVKDRTSAETPSTVYDKWYQAVYSKAVVPGV